MKKLIVAVLALGLASVTQAQQWPTKAVRFINPFPAGGGTDTFARPLAAVLTKNLGHQFIVENQGGAGGTIGAANAARSTPDGYTFLIGAVHHTIAPGVYAKLSYDIEKDLVPITLLAVMPNVLVLNQATNFKTVKELEAYAKANPGKLNYGTPGSGTSQHLAAELFKMNTNTFMVHIPYRGLGPAMQDFLAGNFEVLFDGMGASAAQIRARQDPRHRPDGGAAPSAVPGHPDHGRTGLSRHGSVDLVCDVGRERHAATDPRQDVPGDGEGVSGSRSSRRHGKTRPPISAARSPKSSRSSCTPRSNAGAASPRLRASRSTTEWVNRNPSPPRPGTWFAC